MYFVGNNIDEFMSFYRTNFPKATCLPKMHMLEDHMVPWLRQWRVGCGYMGEQGAEALHANFNTCERSYSNMRDRVKRIKTVLQNHHMQILPQNVDLLPPPIKKRKASPKETLHTHTHTIIDTTHTNVYTK